MESLTVQELIEQLQDFNPNAKVCVRVNDERHYINGWSWMPADGETWDLFDPTTSKLNTTRVTIRTMDDVVEED